jgi:hypothetical protein
MFFFKYRKLIVIFNIVTFIIPYATAFYYLAYSLSMWSFFSTVGNKGVLNKVSLGFDFIFVILLLVYFYFGNSEWLFTNIERIQIGSLIYLLVSATIKFILLPNTFGDKFDFWLLLCPQLFHFFRGNKVFQLITSSTIQR